MKHCLVLENSYREDTLAPESVLDLEGYGRWTCCVDNPNAGIDRPCIDFKYFNILEVHKGWAWREVDDFENDRDFTDNKVVFRVSKFVSTRGVSLGDCVILNKEQMVEVRDLLNAMIDEIDNNSKRED